MNRIRTAALVAACLLTASMATRGPGAQFPFELEVRVKNLSPAPAVFSFAVSKSMQDFNGYKDWDFLPMMGYAGKSGLTDQKPAKSAWLGRNEDSGWMKMPGIGKGLHVDREGDGPFNATVEVRVKSKDQDVSRVFSWADTPATLHVCLYYFPESAKPPRLILKTADEFVDDMRVWLRNGLKDIPAGERSPRRIPFYTDYVFKTTDDPGLIRKHFALLKEIGLNGMFDQAGSVMASRLIQEAGFPFIAQWTGVDTFPFNYADLEMNRTVRETEALNQADTYVRSFNRDRVTCLHGDDELWCGFLEPFIALGDRVKPLVVSYLRQQNVPPADLGVKDYGDIRIIPPGAKPPYAPAVKKENPALFYWLNRARMNHLAEQCSMCGELDKKFYPGVPIDSPNWPWAPILNGGYEEHSWDLHLLYRKGGVRGTDGEPNPGFNFCLQGVYSFYADFMRSYMRDRGRMGGYVITMKGSYPRFLNHFEVYELLARGIADVHWFSYGGMWGRENNTTDIVQDLLLEQGIIHHEAAIFENHLLDTKPEQAKVAILWTPAQEIWEPALHQEIVALYYLLLHANYAVDIVSGYDVNDGCLKKYQVLYMPFAYIERDTWSKVRSWVERGGRLVLDGGMLKDEYNRPIALGEWMKGYAVRQEKREAELSKLMTLIFQAQLDTAGAVDSGPSADLPVLFSKALLTAPAKGKTTLKYQKGGGTAAVETGVGKGKVTSFGFCAGLAYVRDEINREHPNWSEITAYHNFSPAVREMLTAPVREAGIGHVCGISDDMVVARRRVGVGGKQCIVLFDYHFGHTPETPVLPEWENIGDRTVKVDVGSARAIQSVRGEIRKRDGPYVWVKFKGVDMLLVN